MFLLASKLLEVRKVRGKDCWRERMSEVRIVRGKECLRFGTLAAKKVLRGSSSNGRLWFTRSKWLLIRFFPLLQLTAVYDPSLR